MLLPNCTALSGVQQLRVNDKCCLEVARLLGVHYTIVKEEVTNVSSCCTVSAML